MKIMQFNFTQNKFPSASMSLSNNYQVVSLSNYSPPAHTPTFLSLLERPKIYTGYINGYRQPVANIKIQIACFTLLQTQVLRKALHDYFSEYSVEFNSLQSEQDLVACLGQGILAIQKAANFPLFESIKIDVFSTEENIFNLWIPALHEDCFHQAMAFMLQFISFHIASEQKELSQMFASELNKLINELKSYAPNMNTYKFLEAAFHEKVPVRQLPQNVFQFGQSYYSRWMDSSFTDITSVLGARLSKDKLSTGILLEKAGLPIPEQKVVRTESEALAAARNIGYPVVIKPHNQDAGKGVFAGLITDNQVKQAYAAARESSEFVLLEKHIIGKDYRLLVYNGELIWAIERTPAGVTGDGSATISELIYRVNQDREKDVTLKQINISEDMLDFLADQGYELDSILSSGQFLPLSRIANISHGGTPVAVFDQVHPDNKLLAETAANLLRLDLAGIDFICPDIRQSWLTTGGAIIEVNSQPQIGTVTSAHLYKQILNKITPNQARIPIFVICSNAQDDLFTFKLHATLSRQYENIGIARDNSVYINKQKISQGISLYNAGESLLLNTNVDALIFCVNQLDDIEAQGMPFDRYDYLFFLDAPSAATDAVKKMEACLINGLFQSSHRKRYVDENMQDYLAQFGIEHKSNVVLSRHKMLDQVFFR